VVISGGHDHIAQASHRLNDAGFRTRVLQIPIAAHSPMLDPVLDDFEAAFNQIKLNEPQIGVVSSMSGQFVSHELTQPTYWRQHLRNPIRFAEAMQSVAAQGVTIFIELGPKPTLLGMGQQIWVDGRPQTVDASTSYSLPSTPLWLPSLQPPFTDWQTMLHCLSQLFVHGVPFDWAAAEGDWIALRQRVILPTYPFQRQSYWADETFVTPVKINRTVPVNRLSPTTAIAPPPDPLTLSLREQLATSLVTERSGMVTRFLQDQVRHILRLNSSQAIPLTRPLKELGLDSLMSGEFVTILDKTLQVKLPVQRLMGGGTLDSVAQMVLEKLNLTEVESRPQTVDTSTSYSLPSTVDTTDFHSAAADIPQIHAVVTEQQNRKLKVGDKWVFDFASCNYLGLDLHPEVMAAVLPAIQKWGVHPSWTRAVASPAIYEELEAALADLMGCYSTLVFPAVTLLHSGVISVLAGYDGVIFKDISAHKSIDEA
jgi:acyl transferase domain-containing protein